MSGPLGETDVNEFGSQQTANGVVNLLTPLTMVWRRDVPVDSSSFISADTSKGALEFSTDTTGAHAILEGEWVILDASSGEASIDDAGGNMGYMVWAGTDRQDIASSGGITILCGSYIAEVSEENFDDGGTYNYGTPLYIGTGSWVGKLTSTDPGSGVVVARIEGSTTRNGKVYYRIRVF